MYSCGIDRACPGFYLTEEDIKKFIEKVKGAIKYLFKFISDNNYILGTTQTGNNLEATLLYITTLCNLHKQFRSDITKVDKNRLDLDLAFLKALNPSINNNLARESLLKVYGKLKGSLD